MTKEEAEKWLPYMKELNKVMGSSSTGVYNVADGVYGVRPSDSVVPFCFVANTFKELIFVTPYNHTTVGPVSVHLPILYQLLTGKDM